MSDKLLTVKEVSSYLNMHQVTIYKMLKAGKIPAFKIGGQWRFKKEAIDKWIMDKMNEN